ncbi:MAG: 1,4-alpha-glucan branching protein GlgB [Candidatus Omnitrophica bacterium]|nr:1,4-alpha-glucan branching protein GlgB [Candidatus Omnitrophota bacterium]
MKKIKAQTTNEIRYDVSLFTEQDSYLFKEGTHFRLYQKLGSHLIEKDGVAGTYFAVMAPNAESVCVIGDFNGWNNKSHALKVRWDSSGIWEGFIPTVSKGDVYKFFIRSRHNGYEVEKRDPFANYCEIPPKTASIVWDLDYQWHDHDWMKNRRQRNSLSAPISIYELHFGSWRRKLEEGSRSLTYREMVEFLISYVKDMGFTHVEFLPLMAFPFEGSWGYQTVGYFAPTSRYGTPQEFMYLIDQLHQNEIGIILDWVPSHFPSDEHGLAFFDGTHLFEHEDDRKGFHPDWKSYIYNYGRREVINFLISSALFWLDKFHVDGLRVDGVASMLYLDYSRNDGEWIPNKYGGRENIEAISFLKKLNASVYQEYPDVQMIAEESTAWTGVSRPIYSGGLGFGLKWNMGWMHDTLEYFKKDCIHRKYHQNDITFSMIYAFTENFLLSLSHDEVVHGKGSLLRRMPGDDWQKFANLRLLYGYMYGHPGKKLLFMGNEFAQWDEWNHDKSMDWHLLDCERHQGIQRWVRKINEVYKQERVLFYDDFTPGGFEWIDNNDAQNSVFSFIRKASSSEDFIVVVCNFTPIPRYNYRIGVPQKGLWFEILNSDDKQYGGSGMGNPNSINAEAVSCHGRECSVVLTLPPLGVLFLKHCNNNSKK